MTILGFTDSKNECDCGKTGLKGVYIVETGNGETLNLGSSCVKKNWDLNQKEFKTKVKEGYNKSLKLANYELEDSEEYKTKNNEAEKIEQIRVKYNLDKRHFKTYYRAYSI